MSLCDYTLPASVWACSSPSGLTLLLDLGLIRRVHSPIHPLDQRAWDALQCSDNHGGDGNGLLLCWLISVLVMHSNAAPYACALHDAFHTACCLLLTSWWPSAS